MQAVLGATRCMWCLLCGVTVTRSRYVRMTCNMMNEFGCSVQAAGDGCWTVPRSGYSQISVAEGEPGDHNQRDSSASRAPCRSSAYTIEPDASSATYFLAMAAVTGVSVLRPLVCCCFFSLLAWTLCCPRSACFMLFGRRSCRGARPPPPPLFHAGRRCLLRVSSASLTASDVQSDRRMTHAACTLTSSVA